MSARVIVDRDAVLDAILADDAIPSMSDAASDHILHVLAMFERAVREDCAREAEALAKRGPRGNGHLDWDAGARAVARRLRAQGNRR